MAEPAEPIEPAARPVEHQVHLDPIGPGDLVWLAAIGLDPELIGRQYHPVEAPLQLVIAPLRALRGPGAPARLVVVDGRRAGYIGPNPLSGNYEYVLRPWARGGGVGRRMIAEFLRRGRRGDRSRAFFVSSSNDRSFAALRGALDDLGWVEGEDWWVTSERHGRKVHVRPG